MHPLFYVLRITRWRDEHASEAAERVSDFSRIRDRWDETGGRHAPGLSRSARLAAGAHDAHGAVEPPAAGDRYSPVSRETTEDDHLRRRPSRAIPRLCGPKPKCDEAHPKSRPIRLDYPSPTEYL